MRRRDHVLGQRVVHATVNEIVGQTGLIPFTGRHRAGPVLKK